MIKTNKIYLKIQNYYQSVINKREINMNKNKLNQHIVDDILL